MNQSEQIARLDRNVKQLWTMNADITDELLTCKKYIKELLKFKKEFNHV